MTNNKFIKAKGEKGTLYIKVPDTLLESLCDILHEGHHVVQHSNGAQWDYNIEGGDSYEIMTLEEVEEFAASNRVSNVKILKRIIKKKETNEV